MKPLMGNTSMHTYNKRWFKIPKVFWKVLTPVGGAGTEWVTRHPSRHKIKKPKQMPMDLCKLNHKARVPGGSLGISSIHTPKPS